MCDVRSEIHLVRRNIISTRQSVRALKKYVFRLGFKYVSISKVRYINFFGISILNQNEKCCKYWLGRLTLLLNGKYCFPVIFVLVTLHNFGAENWSRANISIRVQGTPTTKLLHGFALWLCNQWSILQVFNINYFAVSYFCTNSK